MKIYLPVVFLCLVTSILLPADTIEISNTGSISMDQETETIIVDGDVEVHKAPYYLYSDQVIWNQKSETLKSVNNVRVLLSLDEPGSEPFRSLLSENPEDYQTGRHEVLTTDTLYFDLKNNHLMPEGSAKVQFGLARIIGNDFSIDLNTNAITTGTYRVGFNNLFLEGNELTSEGNEFHAKNAKFFLGEPEKFSIQGKAKEVIKESDSSILFKGMLLKLGPVPLLYIPRYHHDFKNKVFTVTGSAGYSSDIGGYIELRPTYQPHKDFKFYLDTNFYSERGVMAGPGFDITIRPGDNQQIDLQLNTGFIEDNGNLGLDVLDKPISSSRHYADFDYVHSIDDNAHIIGKIQKWSDSEILRDFDTGEFRKIQQPETFLEASWVKENIAIEIATQLRFEDFEYATEKLPEYKLTLLPTPLSETGFYHSAQFSGAHLQNNDPDHDEPYKHTRYRAFYELLKPIHLKNWLDFIPQATVQSLHFSNINGLDSSLESHHFEAGFDLNAYAYGQWETESKIWDIFGLRHMAIPTLQFRQVSEIGNSDDTLKSAIEKNIYRTGLDDIDLTAYPHLDDLEAYSYIRMGIANRIIAKSKNGSVRELMKLDIFHDSYIPTDNDSSDQHMLVGNLRLTPAYWLKLSIQSRFNSEDLQLNDLFAKINVIDGDAWDLDLSTQFIQNDVEQYLVHYRHKLTESVRFVSSLGYDSRSSKFYEQLYGFQFGLSNYWDLFFSVRMREGSKRNNETRFELKVRAANF